MSNFAYPVGCLQLHFSSPGDLRFLTISLLKRNSGSHCFPSSWTPHVLDQWPTRQVRLPKETRGAGSD